MTPKDLAEQFTPTVREACERSKADIMASLPAFQRTMAKALWGQAMKYGVPAELRIVIELAIGQYQKHLEPHMGDILMAIKPLLDTKKYPELSTLVDILDLLETDQSNFTQAVQETLSSS